MTNDKIMRIVLAAAVLLGLSWPAAAQQRAPGTVTQLDLNVTARTAALEAEPIDLLNLNDLEVVDADAEPTVDAATTSTEPTAEAEEVVLEGPYGQNALTSWGSRTDGDGPVSHVRTVILKMRRPR